MKKILLLLSLIFILIPVTVSASWYNPITWFNKPNQSIVKPSAQAPQAQTPAPQQTVDNIKNNLTKSTVKNNVIKQPNKLSNAAIIKKIKPSVVYIETDDGSGSGMVISTDGFILTNAHVVKGFNIAKVTLYNKITSQGTVIGRDENADLALLKINKSTKLTKIEFGDSDKVQQGDSVFTLGFPFGIKGDVSFKDGTLSRRIDDGSTTYLEISAEIHPGNSGGPLVNSYGQVVGISTATFGKSISGIQVGETIKLAIPMNLAINLLPELKAGENAITNINTKLNTVSKETNDTHNSCDSLSDEAISFDIKYSGILDISRSIFSDFSYAGGTVSETGIAAFQHWYKNWVSIHDKTKRQVAAIKQKTKLGTFSTVNQNDLTNLNIALAQNAIMSDSYYDQHLDTLNFISKSTYFDDYITTKMKDLLSLDNDLLQQSNTYYDTAYSIYNKILTSYNQTKITDGCPLKMPRTIKRSVIRNITMNPSTNCVDLGIMSQDVNICNLYKQFQSYYNWKIIEDNKQG